MPPAPPILAPARQPPPQGEQADSWGLAFILVTLVMAIGVMYFLHWSKFRYMPESVGVILIGAPHPGPATGCGKHGAHAAPRALGRLAVVLQASRWASSSAGPAAR